ncbi:MAG: DEAD/DEAH box helicase [Burkholderiales bacterium]
MNRWKTLFPGRSREIVITTSFENLGLSAELLRAVAEQGYTTPTPIQVQAIPLVLAGRDLLAAAQTGTGKTAGFTLPILQRLSTLSKQGDRQHGGRPRVLVLVPTRELAAQVQTCVRDYGKYLGFRSTVIFGGVSMNNQIDELRRGVDIVVATPGRLLDHAGERTIDLGGVTTLVLDEADRMLDMGFVQDIRKVLKLLPTQRQNLLFSATFSEEIRSLAGSFLTNPATVDIAPRNSPIELISQIAHPVDRDRRRALLSYLIKQGDWQQVLVFTRTKHGANRLAEQLTQDGIEADAIHGNKSQGARTRALKSFKDSELRVLVATDIAARGLDIEGLPHVVNYDLPNVSEDYVHRIGRTGRAGSEGQAVALVCGEERSLFADIEKLMKKKVERKVIAGFEPGPGYETARFDLDQARGRNEPREHRPGNSRGNGGPRGGNNGRGPEAKRGPAKAGNGRRGEPRRFSGTRAA